MSNQKNTRINFLICFNIGKKINKFNKITLKEVVELRNIAYDKMEVTDKMLHNDFYITNNRILRNINNKQNTNKIFEKSSLNKKFLIILMIVMILSNILIYLQSI